MYLTILHATRSYTIWSSLQWSFWATFSIVALDALICASFERSTGAVYRFVLRAQTLLCAGAICYCRLRLSCCWTRALGSLIGMIVGNRAGTSRLADGLCPRCKEVGSCNVDRNSVSRTHLRLERAWKRRTRCWGSSPFALLCIVENCHLSSTHKHARNRSVGSQEVDLNARGWTLLTPAQAGRGHDHTLSPE